MKPQSEPVRCKIALLHVVRSLSLVLSLTLVTGCSMLGLGDEEPSTESEAEESTELQAKELTTEPPKVSESPEAELVRSSKRLYQAGMYTLARESFEALKSQYPMGAYAQFADLKVADSHYYNSEFTKAAKSYEEFLKNHPSSPNAPYAKLQAARAHMASSRGTGRDRTPLERSLVLFDEVVTQYPQTTYARIAATERKPVIEQLAEYDQMIIRFYERQENTAAVAARKKIFDDRWASRLAPNQLSDSDEAETQMVAALEVPTVVDAREPVSVPKVVGVDSSREDAPAVVAVTRSVPSEPLVDAEKTVVASAARASGDAPSAVALTEPKVLTATKIARADIPERASEVKSTTSPQTENSHLDAPQLDAPTVRGRIPLSRVVCRRGSKSYALIEIGHSSSPLLSTLDGETVSPRNGSVSIPQLQFTSDRPLFDCFAAKDFSIDAASGSLSVKSRSDLTISTLNNPPRLLLVPSKGTSPSASNVTGS